MILRSTQEIANEYRDSDTPINVFLSFDTDDLLGISHSEYDKILFVQMESDYKKIWEKCPNAIRIGQGETTPYDEGIVGYIPTGNGNGCIVYLYHACCEAMSRAYNIDYMDAVDDMEYNTMGSLPMWEVENRPYIIFEPF